MSAICIEVNENSWDFRDCSLYRGCLLLGGVWVSTVVEFELARVYIIMVSCCVLPFAAYLQDATYVCERSVTSLADTCASSPALDALNAFQTFSLLQVLHVLVHLIVHSFLALYAVIT